MRIYPLFYNNPVLSLHICVTRVVIYRSLFFSRSNVLDGRHPLHEYYYPFPQAHEFPLTRYDSGIADKMRMAMQTGQWTAAYIPVKYLDAPWDTAKYYPPVIIRAGCILYNRDSELAIAVISIVNNELDPPIIDELWADSANAKQYSVDELQELCEKLHKNLKWRAKKSPSTGYVITDPYQPLTQFVGMTTPFTTPPPPPPT